MGPASKNHMHSVHNPYSQFRNGWSVEQVLAAPKINKQLTKFMCSPTSVASLAQTISLVTYCPIGRCCMCHCCF